jgi:tetratricopeptide (TPR) repeat protein
MVGERLRALIFLALLVTSAQHAAPACAQQAPSTAAQPGAAPSTAAQPGAAPSSAPANPPPAEPTPEAKERARAAYAQGQAAFAQGDYAQAKAAFEQAFASVPNPIVLISVAESAAKSGAIAEAIAAYDRYLQLKPEAADRADVESKRAALAATPAQLSVVTEPPGAEVIIDGRPIGKQTPADIALPAGDHQLKCTLAGYEDALDVVHSLPGGHDERRIVLKRPIPPPVAVAPAPAPPLVLATPPAKVPTAALWVTGSIGAAGLIAGTVLGIMALQEHKKFNENPTTESADRGERLALFADVGFGVGAMALVTAVVLLFDRQEAVPAPAASTTAAGQARNASAHLQLLPQFSPGGAAASARVRF